jgi:hypothetical protein
MPIFQKNTFVWMGRIKSTPAPATRGPGSIIISVRTAVSRFAGLARADRPASGFPWVRLTIPHSRRRPHHSGRRGVTHRRLTSAMSSTGTPSRRHPDSSPPRTYGQQCPQLMISIVGSNRRSAWLWRCRRMRASYRPGDGKQCCGRCRHLRSWDRARSPHRV